MDSTTLSSTGLLLNLWSLRQHSRLVPWSNVCLEPTSTLSRFPSLSLSLSLSPSLSLSLSQFLCSTKTSLAKLPPPQRPLPLDTRPMADCTSGLWPLPSRLVHPYQVAASSYGICQLRVGASPSCIRACRLNSGPVPDSTRGLWPLRRNNGLCQQKQLACARESIKPVAVGSDLACGRMC